MYSWYKCLGTLLGTLRNKGSHLLLFSVFVVQSLSCVWLFGTPWTAAHQLPLLHRLSELIQTHVCWVSDAIQPSYPLLPPSLHALISTCKVSPALWGRCYYHPHFNNRTLGPRKCFTIISRPVKTRTWRGTPLVVQWLRICNVGDVGSIPSCGTKIPHSTGQQSPSATTKDPVCCK